MIYVKIDNTEFYDDSVALVKSFYPRTEVALFTGSISDGDTVIEADVPLDMEKREAHEWFKKHLYIKLKEMTGTDLPWGFVTGVRPSKAALNMLEKGAGDDAIREFFVDEHFVAPKKTDLAIKIAKKELSLLSRLDYEKGYSLYIGIPFCPTTCLYCSFTSYPLALWQNKVDQYLDALIKELAFTAKLMSGRRPDSIYIGGGTPTTLSASQLDRLLSVVDDLFDTNNVLEFTVEAGRPDSITKDKLVAIKNHRVTRISINPQTMNQETLDLIGRKHSVEQIIETFGIARECGFDNINMDMILALPGEGLDQVNHTLDEIAKLRPESLTVHSLAIKRAAALNIWRDKYIDYDLKNSDEIVEATASCAAKLGMEPYYMYRQKNMAGNFENVGYSLSGKECIYNVLIMEEKQTIVACGAGASTKIVFQDENRIERIENVKNVSDYVARIDEMIERKRAFFEENFKKL